MSAFVMPEADCEFEDVPLRISDSAFIHMNHYSMDMYTLCDMLHDHVDCPKMKKTGKPFRKDSKRVCSRRNGKTYNIILDKVPYCDGFVWSVSHLEPI
jgi:hypothetical protein